MGICIQSLDAVYINKCKKSVKNTVDLECTVLLRRTVFVLYMKTKLVRHSATFYSFTNKIIEKVKKQK